MAGYSLEKIIERKKIGAIKSEIKYYLHNLFHFSFVLITQMNNIYMEHIISRMMKCHMKNPLFSLTISKEQVLTFYFNMLTNASN